MPRQCENVISDTRFDWIEGVEDGINLTTTIQLDNCDNAYGWHQVRLRSVEVFVRCSVFCFWMNKQKLSKFFKIKSKGLLLKLERQFLNPKDSF